MAVVAVGIGLAAMVFAVADAFVWRPLPYADPSRLVAIDFERRLPTPGQPVVAQGDLPSLKSWRARVDIFDDIAAFEDRDWLHVQVGGQVLPVRTVAASVNFFEVLGLTPRWSDSDNASVLVSHRLAAMISSEGIQAGRVARLVPDGVVHVDGILPREFLLPEADRAIPPDALVILADGPVMRKDGPSTSWPHMVGRLRAGISPDIASAALTATMPAGEHVEVVPLRTALTERVRGVAIGGLAASGLIVAVCWMNVFSVALTRGLYRASDLATRTALGATPKALTRLFLRDALAVGAMGSVAAALVAVLTLGTVVRFIPSQFATLGLPAITMRVVVAILLTGSTAGVAWLLASLAAWHLGVEQRPQLVPGRDGRAVRVLRFAVVAGQLAATTVFLACAVLLGRSYLNLISVHVGMDNETETLTVAHDSTLPLPLWHDTIDQTVAALRRLPGVLAVGVSGSGFLDGRSAHQLIRELDIPRDRALLDATTVSGNYFDAMGVTFVAGRAPGLNEIVVNQTLAQLLSGDESPVGRAVSLVGGRVVTIAGVIRDVRSRGITTVPRPALYDPNSGSWSRGPVTYVVSFDNRSLRAGWTGTVQQVDRMAVVLDSGTIGERLGRSIRDRTFATVVVSLLALATVVVTGIGLTGIVAYTVVRRTREIAIRLAIGASRRRVTVLVVREAVTAAVCGVSAGLVASAWFSASLRSLLFGVGPTDPLALLGAGVGLVLLVLCAAGLPAVRAASISPAVALRID